MGAPLWVVVTGYAIPVSLLSLIGERFKHETSDAKTNTRNRRRVSRMNRRQTLPPEGRRRQPQTRSRDRRSLVFETVRWPLSRAMRGSMKKPARRRVGGGLESQCREARPWRPPALRFQQPPETPGGLMIGDRLTSRSAAGSGRDCVQALEHGRDRVRALESVVYCVHGGRVQHGCAGTQHKTEHTTRHDKPVDVY